MGVTVSLADDNFSMRGENLRVILRAKKSRNAEESTPRDMRLVFGAPTTDRPLAS